MKTFVSGKWGNRKDIRLKMDELEELGITITHDWTNFENNMNFGNKNKLSRSAIYDIDGIKQSDFTVVIMDDPKYAYRGTFTEMGCALGLGKTIFLYDPNNISYARTNPFYHHPLVKHYKKWDDLLKDVLTFD